MTRIVWVILGICAYGAAYLSVPVIDHTRHERTLDTTLLFPPDGQSIKLVATGFEEPIADLLWVRTVLVFGERLGQAGGDQWVVWLRKMLAATTILDEKWRTPYYYGGIMLRVIGDINGSNQIFERATEKLPEDWFFPFSLAMNLYMYDKNPLEAAKWLQKAAELPGAPAWYASAAAAFHAQTGERKEAIRYLKGIWESTTDPAIRADTEQQLGLLIHDEIVDQWSAACKDYYQQNQKPLSRPEDIEKLGFKLPPNPRKDEWVVGTDGVVRSQTSEKTRLLENTSAELALIAP